MASSSLEALFYSTCFYQKKKKSHLSICWNIFLHIWLKTGNKSELNLIPFQETDKWPSGEGSKDLQLTLSSSTRSSRFFPRGLMGLTISAMMMSMPLDSCLAIQVCKKRGVREHVNLRTTKYTEVKLMVIAVTYLVFMAGTLAVLGDGLQGLANQVHVILINI